MVPLDMSQFMGSLTVPFSELWGIANQIDRFTERNAVFEAEIDRNFLFSIYHNIIIIDFYANAYYRVQSNQI